MSLPRVPVYMVPGNASLLKGASAGAESGATDFRMDNDYATVTMPMTQSYRYPADRVNGNEVFRRYLNGTLDLGYAKDKAVDAIHKVKRRSPLLPEDCHVLVSLFPGVHEIVSVCSEYGIIPANAFIISKISPMEIDAVRQLVAAHFAEESNWNAGQGGGSVSGRGHTYNP